MASNNFINECKTPAYEDRLGKIVIDGIEYNQANNLTNFEIENSIYNNGTIIGNTYTKSLKFSLINVDKDTEFVSKIANPSVGVKYDNNTTEYIDFDDYTIESLNDEQTKNFTDITGYDSLNTMDKIYVCGLSEGPHTIGEYWQDLLNNLGLETETSSFTNSDIVIPANPFVNNESNSVVLGEIEKVSCNFSRIEKRTRTVNNQEETYHVINLMWFNDDKGETATIDGGGVINNVDRLDKMKLIGNTIQNGNPTPESPVEIQTVTGRQVINVCRKNQLDLSIFSKYNNYYTVVDNNIQVTANDGRAWTSITDYLTLPSGTYTVLSKTSIPRLQMMNLSNNTAIANVFNTTHFTFTLSNTSNVGIKILNATGTEFPFMIEKPMILEGTYTSYSEDFEAYKGGKYELNLGKQLWNIQNGTVELLGITGVCKDGVITLNGTATANAFLSFYLDNNFKWEVGQKYSISCFNDTTAEVRLRINSNGGLDTAMTTTQNATKVFEYTGTPTDVFTNRIQIRVGSGTTLNNFVVKPQIEKGSQPSSYSPYKTPIKLCGIGNYKDYIDRTTGKNLFSSEMELGTIDNTTGQNVNNSNCIRSVNYISVQPNTTYTLSNTMNYHILIHEYGENQNYLQYTGNYGNPKTFTTTSNTYYIRVRSSAGQVENNLNAKYQLEKGNQTTQFEPFGNNKWYIYKTIDKVVYNGTESGWATNSPATGINRFFRAVNGMYIYSDSSRHIDKIVSSHFYRTINNAIGGVFQYQNQIFFMMSSDSYATVQNWKDWLSTHNVELYYVLNAPTVEIIEDNELISQLNQIRLESGTSHISLSGDVTPTLEVNYFDNTPNYEFVTSDYSDLEGSLTEYGPVNCVTLGSPDIGGENVFLQDDDSIRDNGETNVVINAEYFLYTQTLREQAIRAIYNKLLDFRYYDLSLTTYYGKPFLQVGDKIRVNTNEGNVYDTYILKHTFTYDGTFKSVIESPSFTKQEEIVKSTESISNKIKRTEIMVDKANGQITSLTSRTENLENTTYTIEQTNELIQTARTGLTNTFSEAGGNNIFRNTGLWFATSDENNPYEYWNGVVAKQKEDKASNMSAMLLQIGNVSQEQDVPNGTYTLSFKYKRLKEIANAKVYINDSEYVLNEVGDTEFVTGTIDDNGDYIVPPLVVNSQHINVRFNCDTIGGFEIYDLMVNAGGVKLAYSQNQNETTTDTVNISKGITITSSDLDVTFKANADGIRTLDSSNNVLTEFTDTGMTTKRAVIQEKSEIVGTLFQTVGNQTWITKL